MFLLIVYNLCLNEPASLSFPLPILLTDNGEKLLAEKDQAEQEALQELRAIAEKDLQEWYAHYNDQLSKTKATNRLRANAFVCFSVSVCVHDAPLHSHS